jgi:glycosyltransferase involved in cell wall biosynthesis
MKLLHVATTLGPKNGGAAVACIELCIALAERGHQVEIFTTAIDIPLNWDVRRNQPFNYRGVNIHFFQVWGLNYYWVSPALFVALWKKIRTFDVIHIHSLYRIHLPVTAWICRFFRRPYLVKPHGSLDPFLFKYRRWRKLPHEFLFDRSAFAHAAAIHYVANEERILAESTKLVTGLKNKGVVVPSAVIVPEGTSLVGINNGNVSRLAVERLILRFPELEDKVIILFLGRLNFKKGIDILIPAFAIVKKAISNAHLLFVGPDTDGYGSQIKIWLREHDVVAETTFTGMLLGDEKAAAFQMASVFVLPSYTENFGIAIVEAMSYGTPVVISNKVNIWREIAEAGAGLVTECDVVQTADAILRVLTDSKLSSSLSAKGARLAKEYFTWPVAATKMEVVYKDILEVEAVLLRSIK